MNLNCQWDGKLADQWTTGSTAFATMAVTSVTKLGDFWKFLTTNSVTKVAQKDCWLMCYFEKDQLKYKLLCILFRQLLGLFFNPASGHTGRHHHHPWKEIRNLIARAQKALSFSPIQCQKTPSIAQELTLDWIVRDPNFLDNQFPSGLLDDHNAALRIVRADEVDVFGRVDCRWTRECCTERKVQILQKISGCWRNLWTNSCTDALMKKTFKIIEKSTRIWISQTLSRLFKA